MHIGKYIHLVYRTEMDLAKAFKLVADAHGDEVDIYQTCLLLSSWSSILANDLKAILCRYEIEEDDEPDRLTQTLLKDPRSGGMALLRDLHDLYLVVNEALICCTVLNQGGTALKDEELVTKCNEIMRQSKRQLSWLMTRIKSAAPQTLIVAK